MLRATPIAISNCIFGATIFFLSEIEEEVFEKKNERSRVYM
jgi:hypothetical protein